MRPSEWKFAHRHCPRKHIGKILSPTSKISLETLVKCQMFCYNVRCIVVFTPKRYEKEEN